MHLFKLRCKQAQALLRDASEQYLHLKEASVSDKLAFRPGQQSYCTGPGGRGPLLHAPAPSAL